MNIDERIMSLLLVAEDQQKAMNETIAKIQPLLDAAGKQSSYLEHVSKEITSSSSKVTDAFNKSLPEFKRLIGEGNDQAIKDALSSVRIESSRMLKESLDPVIKSLQDSVHGLNVAKENINATSNKMTWIFLVKNVVALASFIAIAFFIVSWEGEKYQKLVIENEKLSRDIKTLSDNGARINIGSCGGRVCVEVQKSNSQLWNSDSNTKHWIIPKGY
ncbi:hypothetical protein [Pseudomonas ovata]|uniref:hypothetical protein n=1 Tax=Pseudomonas ovata TaxID=1839709 RepID=UPI0012600E99|nr:hypothetical protein [Pseudomonas ovata]